MMEGGVYLPIVAVDNASNVFDGVAKKGAKMKETLEGKSSGSFFDKFAKGAKNGMNMLEGFVTKNVMGGKSFGQFAASGIKSMIDWSNEAGKLQGKLALALDNGSSVNAFKARMVEAANEARIPFDTLAQSVAGIGMVANDSFSNDELLQFTKSLGMLYSLGGVDTSQIQGSMTQIKQSISSGVLQGDEFRSLKELPGFLEIIADELGVSQAEVKELASEGKITAKVLKDAMINAGDKLQNKLSEIPETFETRMNRVKNVIDAVKNNVGNLITVLMNTQAAVVVFKAIERTIKRLGNQLATLGEFLVKLFGKPKDDAEEFEDTVEKLSKVLTYAFWGLVGVLGILAAKFIITGITGFISMMMAVWPLLLIIAVIALIIYQAHQMGASFAEIFGFIGGIVMFLVAVIWNSFLAVFDFILGIINYLGRYFMTFANFFGNLFNDPISAIIYGMRDMVNTILSLVHTVAKALDKVFGSNLAGSVKGWMDGVDNLADKAAKKFGNGSYEGTEWEDLSAEGFGMKRMEYGSAIESGVNFGYNLGSKLDNFSTEGLFSGVTDLKGLGKENELSDYDASTGKGSLSTNLDDDSIDELKAFAEIQYRLNYKHITPNVNVKFGDVKETADLDDITKYIKKIMNDDLEELYIMEGD